MAHNNDENVIETPFWTSVMQCLHFASKSEKMDLDLCIFKDGQEDFRCLQTKSAPWCGGSE